KNCPPRTCRQGRGVRTTRLRRPLHTPFVIGASASTASLPAFVTIMIRPSVGWDGNRYSFDLGARSTTITAAHWHDGQINRAVRRTHSRHHRARPGDPSSSKKSLLRRLMDAPIKSGHDE